MKRPLVYITAAWSGDIMEDTDRAARYCRAVYEAGYSPVCPMLFMPLFLNSAISEDQRNGIDMSRDLLRRAHVLIICGYGMSESVKSDIAIAARYGITATTLDGILAGRSKGRVRRDD